ncbi:hypothetical protein K0B04_03970 [Patescibacteria group bacterium]|nr:hypothetical protein [Patescibacteria group bacterium]
MIKIPNIGIEKKTRYLIQSLLAGLFIYIFTQDVIEAGVLVVGIFSFVLVSSGSLISHYPGITKQNFLLSIIMPLGVLVGALLSLSYYPNLGYTFKILVTVFFAGIYYLVSLSDNIFLVVQDREEIIPLYRVAVTWSQILQVIVAIPLFAGIFKMDSTAYVQSFLVGFISILFTFYQLWIYRFEPDAKRVGVGEKTYLCLISFFMVFTLSFSVSFFPSEDFLRALYTSSVLLFVLNYISGHLKNEISRKLIFRYLFLCIVFLLLVIFFRP